MITRETEGTVPGGRVLPVTLGYNPAHDPWSIDFTFHEKDDVLVTWTVDRELLGEGIRSRTFRGLADLKVRHNPTAHTVVLGLSSSEGRILISMPCKTVLEFLADTYRLCPTGTESVDWDDTIARILEGA